MLRAIVADDEETIRNGMVRLIKNYNIDLEVVGTAEDGQQALEIINQFRPEIILIDINMPFITGLDVIEKIRKLDKSSKIIIISGYGQFEYAQKALSLGVFNYLLKPVDYREFKNILIKAMDSYNENILMHPILNNNFSGDIGTQIVEYIKSNYNKNLNVQELSLKFHTSQSNLTKLIKHKTGQSFTDYLNNIRISIAKKLLLNEKNNFSINNISDMVGYSSQHYFSRAFKNYTGTSPLQFRNNKL